MQIESSVCITMKMYKNFPVFTPISVIICICILTGTSALRVSREPADIEKKITWSFGEKFKTLRVYQRFQITYNRHSLCALRRHQKRYFCTIVFEWYGFTLEDFEPVVDTECHRENFSFVSANEPVVEGKVFAFRCSEILPYYVASDRTSTRGIVFEHESVLRPDAVIYDIKPADLKLVRPHPNIENINWKRVTVMEKLKNFIDTRKMQPYERFRHLLPIISVCALSYKQQFTLCSWIMVQEDQVLVTFLEPDYPTCERRQLESISASLCTVECPRIILHNTDLKTKTTFATQYFLSTSRERASAILYYNLKRDLRLHPLAYASNIDMKRLKNQT